MSFQYNNEYKKLLEDELYGSKSFKNIIKTIKENYDLVLYSYYSRKGYNDAMCNVEAYREFYCPYTNKELKSFGNIIHSELKDNYIKIYVSGSYTIFSHINYLFDMEFIHPHSVYYMNITMRNIFRTLDVGSGIIIFKLTTDYYKKVFLTSKLSY